MNKIKDLIYDFNDIFVALFIVIITACIIVWRVDIIMDYPAFLATTTEQNTQTNVDLTGIDLTPEITYNQNDNPENLEANNGEGNEANNGEQNGSENNTQTTQENNQGSNSQENNSQQGSENNSTVASDTKFEIKQGEYGATVGKKLEAAGLVSSANEFVNELNRQGVASRIQVGTFTIPAGASIADIVKILTK